VSPARVLIVDNDPWIQRMVATILGQAGHLVNLAGDAQGALTCAGKVLPEVVITTVSLPASTLERSRISLMRTSNSRPPL